MAMDGIFGDYQNIYSAKPITKNQDQFRRVITAICDLQIERKKMTVPQKQAKLKKVNKKLADLRAY